MRWDRVHFKWMLEMVSVKSFGLSNRTDTALLKSVTLLSSAGPHTVTVTGN